jgi:large conductance mechanosensitive channel
MGLVSEFKEFALKGNALDLAVGVIIGGAFGGIVNSLIGDVIMPVVSMAGNVDYSNWFIGLNEKVRAAVTAAPGMPLAEAKKIGPVLAYGSFLTVAINFLILAACIFMVVKAFNTARKRFEAQKPVVASGPTPDQKLLVEIRDLLAKK